jgi:hypothetical protein
VNALATVAELLISCLDNDRSNPCRNRHAMQITREWLLVRVIVEELALAIEIRPSVVMTRKPLA